VSVRVDTRELRQFKEKLENINTDSLLKEIAADLAARLLRKVKKRTPVDTGELRRNWQVSNIRLFERFCVVEIYNSTEYAEYVEFGHRQTPGRYVPALGKRLKKAWVPGKFMLTLSAKELENMKDRIVRRKVEEWLKEVF
jgi:hypothetical protein